MKEKRDTRLCFLALLPPAEARDDIEAIRKDFADRFGVSHALRLPAHITVVPPFRISGTRREVIGEGLRDFVKALPCCRIHLQDFGFFHRPQHRVIFLSVLHDPGLISLQAALAGYMTQVAGLSPESRPYHPHLTVAHRDLDEPTFIRARDYCAHRKFSMSFMATEVTWLDHNGRHWELRDQYSLGADPSG